MKGEVLIHTETGEITTTLPTPIERNNEIGVAITNILQDIQMYMKQTGGAVGDLKKTVLRLGDEHEVRIVVGAEHIKAVVKEVGAKGGIAE